MHNLSFSAVLCFGSSLTNTSTEIGLYGGLVDWGLLQMEIFSDFKADKKTYCHSIAWP